MRLACFHFTSVGFILSRLITCLSYAFGARSLRDGVVWRVMRKGSEMHSIS